MTFNQEGRRFRAIAWRAAEQAEFLDRQPRRRQPRVLARTQRIQGRNLPRAQRRRHQGARIHAECWMLKDFDVQDYLSIQQSEFSISDNTMRWQKIARLAIAVFVVGFAVFVFLAMRQRSSACRQAESRRRRSRSDHRKWRRRTQGLQPRHPDRDPQVRQSPHLQGRPVEVRRRHVDAAES